MRVEPGLAAALVDDVADQPGGLPLLSAALLELWEDGAVAPCATRATRGAAACAARWPASPKTPICGLSAAERQRARAMLLRLADAEEPPPVRRRVAVAELEVERDADAARALAALTESRLVTLDEDAVEVAHEALLREWPRLRGWLAQDADGRRFHQHLIPAREWRDSDRDPAELYAVPASPRPSSGRPSRAELNELERAFLEEGRAASDAKTERQRRTNRRLRTLLAGVGVLLAAAVVAGVIAISERQGARSAATAEAAQRLGAQALTEERLDQALRLANTGVALDDSVATRSGLLSTLVRNPAVLGILLRADGEHSLGLSPNARTLATGDDRGTVILFDTQTRERIGDCQGESLVTWLGFHSRDGSLTIARKDSRRARAYVHVIDATTQRLRRSIPLGGHPAENRGRFYIPLSLPSYATDGRSFMVG